MKISDHFSVLRPPESTFSGKTEIEPVEHDVRLRSERQPTDRFFANTHSSNLVNSVIAIALLGSVVFLDIYQPFSRPWSNLYIVVAVYAALFVRGPLEILTYFCIMFWSLLIPVFFRSDFTWTSNTFWNRLAGVTLGWIIVALLWGRRGYLDVLRTTNDELESKVKARTCQLQAAIESLQREIV